MRYGSRVYLKDGSPRNAGTVLSIIHKNIGTFCSIRWDNGWLSTFEASDLAEIEDDRGNTNECDVLRRKIADRIDGYDRDDLGESPDF